MGVVALVPNLVPLDCTGCRRRSWPRTWKRAPWALLTGSSCGHRLNCPPGLCRHLAATPPPPELLADAPELLEPDADPDPPLLEEDCPPDPPPEDPLAAPDDDDEPAVPEPPDDDDESSVGLVGPHPGQPDANAAQATHRLGNSTR